MGWGLTLCIYEINGADPVNLGQGELRGEIYGPEERCLRMQNVSGAGQFEPRSTLLTCVSRFTGLVCVRGTVGPWPVSQ